MLALHRTAFQRWSLWPLAAFLLLYNRILLWGFLNYLAALAVVLWASGCLDRAGAQADSLAYRRSAAVLATVNLSRSPRGLRLLRALDHGAGSVPGWRKGWSIRGQPTIPALATLAPAGVLFLLAPTSGGSAEISYGNIFRKLDMPVSLFDNYNRVFDGIDVRHSC